MTIVSPCRYKYFNVDINLALNDMLGSEKSVVWPCLVTYRDCLKTHCSVYFYPMFIPQYGSINLSYIEP